LRKLEVSCRDLTKMPMDLVIRGGGLRMFRYLIQ